ncbi:MAG: hypothetical protein V9G24_19845 [Rhodoblastus sp.]
MSAETAAAAIMPSHMLMPELDEQRARQHRARADEQRMGERDLAGDAADDVPGRGQRRIDERDGEDMQIVVRQ